MEVFCPPDHLVPQHYQFFQVIFEAGVVLVIHVDVNVGEPNSIDVVLDVD